MFGKNLKYYRLKSGMNITQLAEKVDLTAMAISNYEKGKRRPEIETLRRIAEVLGVKVMDFISVRDESIVFEHGKFRKNSKLTLSTKEYIYEDIEDYFNRFFIVVNLLGSTTILPKPPVVNMLKLVPDTEKCAAKLREWLGTSSLGPISDLVTLLENVGILVYQIKISNDKFSGLNGMVGGRPYIAINTSMTPERQRFTIAHELVHMAFDWEEKPLDNKNDEERLTNKIAGAFLFPAIDSYRELGQRRSGIQGDMKLAAKEYGISMQCLAYRAMEVEIISDFAYKKFMIEVSKRGWKKNEPSRLEQECSNLFKQLVYRAIVEGEINTQRGAELLKTSYDQVVEELNGFSEGSVGCI